MENDMEKYIRVGTTLYKRVNKPLLNGKEEEMMVPWNLDTMLLS